MIENGNSIRKLEKIELFDGGERSPKVIELTFLGDANGREKRLIVRQSQTKMDIAKELIKMAKCLKEEYLNETKTG